MSRMISIDDVSDKGTDACARSSLLGMIGIEHTYPSPSSYTESNLAESYFLGDATCEGETPPIINIIWNGQESCSNSCSSVYQLFNQSCLKYSARNYLGHRLDSRYIWTSYGEARISVRNLASALHDLLPPTSRVGIYGRYSREWMTAYFACHSRNCVVVLLHDTEGSENVVNMIKLSAVPIIFASHDHAEELFCSFRKLNRISTSTQARFSRMSLVSDFKCLPNLKTVIIMGQDKIKEELKDAAADLGIRIVSMNDLIREGERFPKVDTPTKPDDIASIHFTGGTSSEKKGVLISHRALMSRVFGVLAMSKYKDELGRDIAYKISIDDVHISFLPSSHFEMMLLLILTYSGASIGFHSCDHDPSKLLEDMQILKPTTFACSPYMLATLRQTLLTDVANSFFIAKYIFKNSYEGKTKLIRESGEISNTSYEYDYDHIIFIIYSFFFQSYRNLFGGNLKFILSGAGPVPSECSEFFRIVLGCPFVEAYGLTETGYIALGQICDYSTDNVGPPVVNCQVKLVDCPEFGYLVKSSPGPRGQIAVKGPGLFSGYLEFEKTDGFVSHPNNHVYDKDGWFLTGDIGNLDKKGRLQIIDRVCNIFKLFTGETISPEKIEDVLKQSSLIHQVFIHGSPTESFLIAVIVPNQPALMEWADEKMPLLLGAKNEGKLSYHQICMHPMTRAMYLCEIRRQFENRADHLGPLQSFEIPGAVYIESLPFSPANKLLTPTFKLKRHAASQFYADIFDDLYQICKIKS